VLSCVCLKLKKGLDVTISVYGEFSKQVASVYVRLADVEKAANRLKEAFVVFVMLSDFKPIQSLQIKMIFICRDWIGLNHMLFVTYCLCFLLSMFCRKKYLQLNLDLITKMYGSDHANVTLAKDRIVNLTKQSHTLKQSSTLKKPTFLSQILSYDKTKKKVSEGDFCFVFVEGGIDLQVIFSW